MSLFRLCGYLTAIVLILTASAAPVAAQGPPAKLPPELAVIPPDSFAFLYLRPAELWQSEPAAKLRKMFPQEAEQLLKTLGDDPQDTESLTIVYPSPRTLQFLSSPEFRGRFERFEKPAPRFDPNGKVPPANPPMEPDGIEGMLLIETTVKPVTQAYVLERVLGKGAIASKHGTRTYFAQGNKGGFLPGAVYFVNDKTYVYAFTIEALKGLLTKLDAPRAKGPLSAALEKAAQKRHLVLGINADLPGANALRRELAEDWSFERGPLPTWALAPLLEMRSAVLALDLGKELKLDAELRFPDAKSATKAAGALEDALFLGRFLVNAVQRSGRSHELRGRPEGSHLPLVLSLGEMLLPQLEKGLRRAGIEQRQEVLRIQANIPVDFQPLQGMSLGDDFAVIHIRVAELLRTEFASEFVKLFPDLVREQPLRNLEEIGLSINAIESATIVLPTSTIFGGRRPPRKDDKKRDFEKFEKKEFFDPPKFDDKKSDAPSFEKPKLEKEPEKAVPKELDLDKKNRVGQAFQPDGQAGNPDLREVMFRPESAESFVSQPGFDGNDEDVFIVKITTIKPLDRKKILQGILRDVPKEMNHKGKAYFVSSRDRFGEAVHFVDERTLLIVPAFAMGRTLDRPTLFRAKGAFADAVEAAKKKHPFVFAANLTEASALRTKQEIAAELSGFRRGGGPDSVEAELGRALLPLIDARTFIVSVDEVSGPAGKAVRVQADMAFGDAQQAVGCKDAAQDALTLGRLFILSRGRMSIRQFQVDNIMHDDFDHGPLVFGNRVLVPGEKPVLVPRRDLRPPLVSAALLAEAEAAVRKAKIEQDGATLRGVAQASIDWKELQAQALNEAIALVKQDASDRLMRKSMTNMQRLVNAMHDYHSVHGKFPTSSNLSWRVHVLPFMDELALYKEFKLNEPWDSPHNIKLLPRMPKIFAVAPSGIKPKAPHTTHYQLITGPETVLDGKEKLRNIDGIVLVEASDATAWTKPTDLVYDAKTPLPKLGGVFQDGFHAADIRGDVIFWPVPLNEAQFRARILGSRAPGLRDEKFDR